MRYTCYNSSGTVITHDTTFTVEMAERMGGAVFPYLLFPFNALPGEFSGEISLPASFEDDPSDRGPAAPFRTYSGHIPKIRISQERETARLPRARFAPHTHPRTGR